MNAIQKLGQNVQPGQPLLKLLCLRRSKICWPALSALPFALWWYAWEYTQRTLRAPRKVCHQEPTDWDPWSDVITEGDPKRIHWC